MVPGFPRGEGGKIEAHSFFPSFVNPPAKPNLLNNLAPPTYTQERTSEGEDEKEGVLVHDRSSLAPLTTVVTRTVGHDRTRTR